MRINEHIYQGFFGLKKKQDAGVYYKERVTKLKGFDSDLDEMIESFEIVLKNHEAKIKSYYEFLKKPTIESFKQVRHEIEKLEGMFDQDEIENDKEQKYCIKGINILKDLTKNEENVELGQIEKETIDDMNELQRLLHAIEPVWQKQIDFIEQDDGTIISDKNKIQQLSNIFKEESDILKMEESLLKKIDLKTGELLRKTTLKGRNIERTKDMDMSYREVKHIR